MKRRKGKASPVSDASAAFARGFVATALLVALQGRGEAAVPPATARRVLRHALQGGAALAAGTVAADALPRRDYGLALTAVAAGVAGVVVAEYLLNPHCCHENKENGIGQE